MGSSQPPATEVDLIDSYARLAGEQVEVVLADPGPGIGDGVTVVLRGRRSAQRATLALLDEDCGRRGVVRFERSTLSDGEYAALLVTDAGELPLGCRLLVQGARPLVLLWGGDSSKSRLPVPHPRPATPSTPVQRARSFAGRTQRALSRRVRGPR